MSEAKQNADVSQRDDRFVVTVDGEQAGFTEYFDREDARVFFHTEVDEKFSGEGLGGTLVGQALDQTVSSGKRIVPVCSYVDKYIQKHDEYQDKTDQPDPEVLSLAKEKTG